MFSKDIRRFLLKAVLLAALNAAFGIAVLYLHALTLHYAPWDTDSRLLVMPQNEEFDTVILGSSHAYLLSRFKRHHEILEGTLGMRVMNLAMPTGGGLTPAKFYLEEFFAAGNRTRNVVYLIEPFVFFNAGTNEAHKFVYFEPFQWRFFLRLVMNRFDVRQILTYVRSKFSPDWFLQRPERLDEDYISLEGKPVDPALVARRMETLYMGPPREENFLRFSREFECILDRCREEHCRVYLISVPTLIGHEPGQPRMQQYLDELRKRYDLTYVDFTDALKDGRYYRNLDHLNTPGVEAFVRDLLKPVLCGP